jgi:hypothetical protein
MTTFACVSNWKAFQGTQECRSNLVVSRSEWIMVTGSYKRQTTTYRVLRRVACGAQLDEQTRLREVSRKETPLRSEGSKMPRNPLFAALTDTPRIIHTHARTNSNRSGNTSFWPRPSHSICEVFRKKCLLHLREGRCRATRSSLH